MSVRNELLEGILAATTAGGAPSTVNGIIEVMKTTAAYGNTVKLFGPLAPISLVGTGDATLPPPDSPQPLTGGVYNGYKKVVGLNTIKEGGYITVASSEFIIGVGGSGKYSAPIAWIDVSSSLKDTIIGFVFAWEREGLLYFSQRPVGHRTKESNSTTNIGGGGFISLLEGDKVSLWVAADTSSTSTINDMNIGLVMDISTALEAL